MWCGTERFRETNKMCNGNFSVCVIQCSVLEIVRSSGLDLLARLALPDADGVPLHRVLAAELAEVLGVLADFHLLHDLTKGGAISRPVLADDARLLRALRLVDKET